MTDPQIKGILKLPDLKLESKAVAAVSIRADGGLGRIGIDTEVRRGSDNLITSGAVFKAVKVGLDERILTRLEELGVATEVGGGEIPDTGVVEMSDLTDVDTSYNGAPVANQFLMYNGTYWINAASSIGTLVSIGDVQISPTDNDVIVWDSTMGAGTWKNENPVSYYGLLENVNIGVGTEPRGGSLSDGDILVWDTGQAPARWTNSALGSHSHTIANITGNNWKMYHTNGSGVMTEITLGGANTFLKSTGASSAPIWTSLSEFLKLEDMYDVPPHPAVGSKVLVTSGASGFQWGDMPDTSGFALTVHTHTFDAVTMTNLTMSGGYEVNDFIILSNKTPIEWATETRQNGFNLPFGTAANTLAEGDSVVPKSGGYFTNEFGISDETQVQIATRSWSGTAGLLFSAYRASTTPSGGLNVATATKHYTSDTAHGGSPHKAKLLMASHTGFAFYISETGTPYSAGDDVTFGSSVFTVSKTSASFVYDLSVGNDLTITGDASMANLTVTGVDSLRALYLSGGVLSASTASNIDLSRLAGVTSGVQSQLNSKIDTTGGNISGILSFNNTVQDDIINFNGDSTSDKRGVAFNNRAALTADYNDGWLRLNQGAEFTSGVYVNSTMTVTGAITANLTGTASAASTVSMTSSASASLYDILWTNTVNVYRASSSKFQVRPSTGMLKAEGGVQVSSHTSNIVYGDASGINFGTTSVNINMSTNKATAVDWVGSSDIRLKENIQYYKASFMGKILAVGDMAVSYNRKNDADKVMEIGFIAQDLINVFPEFVSMDGDGMLGVSYAKMVVPLYTGLSEHEREIVRLKERVRILEDKLYDTSI